MASVKRAGDDALLPVYTENDYIDDLIQGSGLVHKGTEASDEDFSENDLQNAKRALVSVRPRQTAVIQTPHKNRLNFSDGTRSRLCLHF